MSAETTLTRRTSSAHKRRPTNLAKASKRNKPANDEELESVHEKEQKKEIKPTARSTRLKIRQSKDAWLQNSFILVRPEHVSSTPVSTQKTKGDTGYVSFAEPKTQQVTLISESQNLLEYGNLFDTQVANCPSQQHYESASNEDFVYTVPPTTRSLMSYSQRFNCTPEKNNDRNESVSPYHRSFNDSDSLFADIDLRDFTPNKSTSAKKVKSKSSKNKVELVTRLNRLSPVKLTFNDNSTWEDCNVEAEATTSNANLLLSRSLVVTSSPRNFDRTKTCVKDSLKSDLFDSDDGVLANIDLNIVNIEQHENPTGKVDSFKKSRISIGPESGPRNCEHSCMNSDSTNCIPVKSKTDIVISDNIIFPTPKAPVNPSCGLTIVERLKKNMRKNARANTPQNNNLRKMREAKILEAEQEAVLLQQQGNEFDIGPFYGLTSKVQKLFQVERGITELYDWQHECMSLDVLKSSKNLIYSLPTSGGKTLVAELLILRELLCKRRDAILILPFVAIVQEKVRGLSPFAVELDFLVEEYAGSKGCLPPKKRRNYRSLYVCTMEKANSLINCFIETERIADLGLVVVDELHMLGEGGSRGAVLEMALTKILHVAENTQIIGMSATLNNIQDLQQFLNAEVYSNDFRPVKLSEYVKLEDTVYEVDASALCPDDRLKHSRCLMFKYDRDKLKQDPDLIAGLVQEVIPKHSCLLFCPTKKNCENVTELLCKMLPKQIKEYKIKEKKALLKALNEDGNGTVCPVLLRSIPYGLAYHHSGLTVDERKLIEEAYSEGTLCLLCCTSTLAAGVNLPAKRVILRSPYVGAEWLSCSQYKQMVGRAGRAGIDSSGESILILQKKDKHKLLELVSGPCDYCRSSLLYDNGKGMRDLLLTSIALKITTTRLSVTEFVRRTLCYVQAGAFNIDIDTVAMQALDSLIQLNLVLSRPLTATDEQNSLDDEPNSVLLVTHLGRAVFKAQLNWRCNVLALGSIDIDRGPQIYRDLQQASDNMVIANHLHLLYLVTPYDIVDSVKPEWMLYLSEISSFDASEIKVTNLVGATESYIVRKVAGQSIRKKVNEHSIKRFYLTLMLYSLWKQQTIRQVAVKFQQTRGFVQQLLSSAAAFASCLSRFCEELEEFWAYQDLLSSFVQRLSYCVTIELIPLMEIPGVKQGRARQLYAAGYKTLQMVAHADSQRLVSEIHHMPRKIAKQIVSAAQMLMQEKAESLRDEAAEIEQAPFNMPPPFDIELDVDSTQTTKWSDSPLSFTQPQPNL